MEDSFSRLESVILHLAKNGFFSPKLVLDIKNHVSAKI